MNALAWLFGLGMLATVFPLVFHLIRRRPKGLTEFSSLMFLPASPPRLTRRSSIENLLLLVLRMSAIALIAAAFMRPFFHSNVSLGLTEPPGRRLAVLLDTSASMKRGDLWGNAIQRVRRIVDSAAAADEIAVYTFDSELVKQSPLDGVEDTAQAARRVRWDGIQPSWRRSELGAALVNLADELAQDLDQDRPAANPSPQIIVVSDMQSGSSTTALQNYQWPANVKVHFEQVATSQQDDSNAAVELLPPAETDPAALQDLVLVRNSSRSKVDQLRVAWAGESTKAVDFYVPPGSSKILRVPRDEHSLDSELLILEGDASDFDNRFFVVPPNQQQISVAYLGNEPADDPEQMLYYFRRALSETPLRAVDIQQFGDSESDAKGGAVDGQGIWQNVEPRPDLVVVTRAVTTAETAAIDQFVADGGSLLVVLIDEDTLASTRAWTGVAADAQLIPATAARYVMLGQVDFAHPIFRPFAGPRLNDFTNIRFWSYLWTELPDNARVIARFENRAPALWLLESGAGSGVIYGLATGWQPASSQLALSSKFLPIVNRLVELAAGTPHVAAAIRVGESFVVPDEFHNARVQVGQRSFTLDPQQPLGSQLDEPGVYRLAKTPGAADETDVNDAGRAARQIRVAVNVHPAESTTEIMPLEHIMAFGVQVGQHLDSATAAERRLELLDQDLESRQKLWKWLILAAILMLLAETWWAGRTDRASFTDVVLAGGDAP